MTKEEKAKYDKNYRKIKKLLDPNYRADAAKRYYTKNKLNILSKNALRYKKLKQIDLNFRLRCNLSSRISNAIRGIAKSKQTIELLGCSVDDLKVYLESKFKDGMSWDNYGKNGWHVDHITPCARYDLSDPEQQKQCFHYTNLQPLWAIENFVKNKYTIIE
jgi:hypothetical protein